MLELKHGFGGALSAGPAKNLDRRWTDTELGPQITYHCDGGMPWNRRVVGHTTCDSRLPFAVTQLNLEQPVKPCPVIWQRKRAWLATWQRSIDG